MYIEISIKTHQSWPEPSTIYLPWGSPKNYVQGPVRIFLRITVDGRRCETSTAQFAEPTNWDQKAGRVKGKSEQAKSINSYLDILQSKLYDSHADLLQCNIPITTELLRNRFNGQDEQSRKIVEIYSSYHKNMEKLIGKDFVQITVRKFHTTLVHLKAFFEMEVQVSRHQPLSIKIWVYYWFWIFPQNREKYWKQYGSKACANNRGAWFTIVCKKMYWYA